MTGRGLDRDERYHVALSPEELSDEAVEAVLAAVPSPEAVANDDYLDAPLT